MKKIATIVGFLGGGLVLFFAVAFFAFYHLIQVGEFRRFFIDEFESRTGLKVEVGEAEVEMGWVVGVSFRDFVLRDPQQARPVITAPRMLMRVALLPLLERKLAFYGLRLHEPRLQIARDDEGKTPVLDLILNLPFLRERDAQFSLDLRQVRIEKGEILFTDRLGGKEPVETRFAEIDLDLRRMRSRGLLGLPLRSRDPATGNSSQSGLNFDMRTIVDREGRQTDLAMTGRALFPEESLDIREAWVEADLKSQTLPAAFLWEYYGRPLAGSAPRGSLAYRVHWQGSLSKGARLDGEARFTGLEGEAPNIFPAAVALGDGRLDVVLDWKPQEIRFERLELRSTGLTFAVQGALHSLGGPDPHVDLSLTTPFLPLTTVRNYIPTKFFQSPRLEYFTAGVNRGEVRISKAAIAGRLSDLRRLFEPGQEERLSLEAEVREAGGDFGADHPVPLRGLSGQIVLEHGVLHYKNFKGVIGQSRLTEINGTQRRALSGTGPLELRIKGETELAQFREQLPPDILPPAVGKAMNGFQELSGKAGLDLLVSTDFGSGYQYEGVVSLDGVRVQIGDISLSQLKGDMLFSPAEVRADRATALLGGSPVQFRLLLKEFAGDQGTFDLTIDSAGVKASEALHLLLSLDSSQSPGIVRGAIRYQGSLASAEKRRLTGSLELVGVQIPFKFFREPFREITGRFRLDGKTVELDGVNAQIGGYGFTLNGRWIGGDKPTLLFSLSSPEMDVEYILPRHVVPDAEWYERLQVRGKLTIDKGKYDKFPFTDLKTDLALEKRIWRLENFSSRSQGGTVEGLGAFNNRSEPGLFTVEPKIKDVPLQGLLSWFDIATTDVTGKVQLSGNLQFTGKTPAERKRNLNGAFRLRIEDGIARRFQLLVRVLSFLDLSRWFTLRMPNINQEGIHFRSVSADFKVTQGVYSTQNLFVDSDDLRITGAGEIDGPKGEIDFVIAVRPFPGLESAWNYIPILGTGLAAIKNSLLVASFNVRGPIHDPSITPAPLSTLSEFFYGALAIPKGLIGIPTVGGQKSIGEQNPADEPKAATDQK